MRIKGVVENMEKYFIVKNFITNEQRKYKFLADYVAVESNKTETYLIDKECQCNNQVAMDILNSVLKDFVLMEFNLM
jgi:hypothetical protein